jgi:N6-adenosine-specific RNA methylase IME4
MILPTVEGGFGCLYADPPWQFLSRSAKGRGRSADRHYNIMTLDDIKAMPVESVAAKHSVLLMWTTDPMLVNALAVMAAWGFTYKTTGFVWAKTGKKPGSFPIGLGFWTRANPEIVLLGTRGKPKRISAGVPKLIISPRRAHSQKPDETHGMIERLCAGPYLELFARRRVKGWTCWGDELDAEN